MILTPTITYRHLTPSIDAGLAYSHYREAGLATYGEPSPIMSPRAYLKSLIGRCEEFPDGHLLAFLGDECLGQLELQTPYGLTTGYVNLFYVSASFRRMGFGTLLHQRGEQYFRSWEADSITLHVSPQNRPATAFYRQMGYHFVDRGGSLWSMEKRL